MSQHYTICPTCQRPTSSIDENGRVHVYTLTLQSVADTIDAKQKAAPAMYEALQKCAEFASKTGSEPEVLVVIMQQIAKISQAALHAADGGE